MGRIHYADSTTAHAARVVETIATIGIFFSLIVLVLIQTVIGWDVDFWFSLLMIFSSMSLVAAIFSIAAILLPYDRTGERGYIPAVWLFEIGAITLNIISLVWRIILLINCDEQPCLDQKRACIIMTVMVGVLIVLSLVDIAASLLLYQNVVANPERGAAKNLARERNKKQKVELVTEQQEADTEEMEDDEESQETTPPDYLTDISNTLTHMNPLYTKTPISPIPASPIAASPPKEEPAVVVSPPPTSVVTQRPNKKDNNKIVF